MATKTKLYFSRIFLFLASVVFIYILFRQFGTLQQAVQTLSSGSWLFVLGVFGIQALSVINKGAYYQSLYDYFGVKDSLKRFVTLTLSSNFVNLAAPTAGVSGMAVFVGEAEAHGLTKGRSTFLNIFAYFIYYSAFLLVLLFGLFYLLFNHQLYQYQIVTAAILFGMIFILLIVLFLALEEAARVKKLFQFLAVAANFFGRHFLKKPELFSKEAVHLISREVNDCLHYIQTNWKSLWLPIFHVFLLEIIDVLALYYLFLAFGYPIYPGVLITTYAIGILFTLISITPGGIGVVEATMILVLTNLKVPVETATIVVFCYRIITYWVPFAAGYFAFRSLQQAKINKIKNGTH